MTFPVCAYALEQPIHYNSGDHYATLDEFVIEVFQHVDLEMRRKPAHMVYEMLQAQLARRLPGITVDDDATRDAAARISVGLPIG